MPNSRLLQQMLKFDFDHYQEETNDGKCPLDPSVICVQKGKNAYSLDNLNKWLIHLGTPIPSALVMWREGISRFSLQPAEPTELESEFYIQASSGQHTDIFQNSMTC